MSRSSEHGAVEPEELIEQARRGLAELRMLLASPEPGRFRAAGETLSKVAKKLRHLKQAVGKTGIPALEPGLASDGNLRAMAESLRHEIAEVKELLDHAGATYQSWSRILESVTSGYDASGRVNGPIGGEFSVQG